ncbi:MAG: fibronectin type III domain-containing protein [Proteobacteria bacterium]|nr:fibronectin type III domain-containing protein [Pseudomonadota bacterium]
MTTTAITWAWGTNTLISFNPTTDTLDFGWFQGTQFTVSEVNGSVVISIPSNNQTYTLEGITLSELQLSNIVAKDSSAIGEWTSALSGTSSSSSGSSTSSSSGSSSGTSSGTSSESSSGTSSSSSSGSSSTGSGSSDGASTSAWSSTAVYTAGNEVTENGVTYIANWWTQGTDPATNNGATGTGQPWTIVSSSSSGSGSSGSGSTDATAWSATGVYTTGQEVVESGIIYEANWWNEGQDPATHYGTGQPWTVVGAEDSSALIPSAPTNVSAAATTSTSTVLSWTASTVAGNLENVTGYAIYENGHEIATTTSLNYKVTGLTADTDYQFSVAAIDAAGTSAESTALAVHTATADTTTSSSENIGVFSPYIDMSMGVDADLVGISNASGVENFTLAFVLSSSEGIGWGGSGTIANDTLSNGSTILQEVQAIQAAGGNITISFGGANGQEPALTATSAAQLQAEYQSVIDRYHVTSLDFDIEGSAETNTASLTLRDQALVGLEAANPDLKVSYTLPVLPTGLDANGLNVLETALKDGVKIDTVNIMAMDYGSAVDNNGQMGLDAINAAIAVEKQLADIGLSAKIGITVMIGVNDVSSEVFTLADAQELVNFAKSDPHISELSIWSVARDNGDSAGATYASATSSGVAQTQYQYSQILHQFETQS